VTCEAREAELLQGLAAGTLEREDRTAAEVHVASCAECRADLGVLEEMVGDIRTLHLTPAEVVAAAGAGSAPEHLADCRTCRDEVALVRRVNADLRGQARRRFGVPHGLAASLLVVALGLGTWNLELRARNAAREEELSSTLARLARSEAAGPRRGPATPPPASPQLNVPIVDLQPAIPSRGTAPPSVPHVIAFPRGVDLAVLVVVTRPLRPHPSYVLEVRDRGGQTVWRTGGLTRSGYDTLTLAIPRSLLPAGTYRLILYGARGGALDHLEEYALDVRHE